MAKAYDTELRELQQRAYGRGADIHLDPAALRRLRELEGRETANGARDREMDEDQHADTAPAAPAAHAEPAAQAAPGAQRRSRSLVAAVLGLVVGMALGVGGTALVVEHGGRVGAIHTEQVARLDVEPGYTLPPAVVNGAGGNRVRAFAEFHGMRTLVTELGSSTDAGTADTEWCIAVYPDAQLASTSAPGTDEGSSGCSAGAFPATAQFQITADAPAALRAAFPTGTALQFAYDKAARQVVVSSDG